MALKDKLDDVVSAAKDLLHGVVPEPSEDSEAEPGIVSPEPDAIEILKADHRRVEALFEEILAEKSLNLTSQRSNIAKVLDELRLHTKIEESIVYPAVYGKTKRDTDERLTVLEAVEEHGSMKELIKKIAKSNGRDETLKAKIQVLSEVTEHHVKEEESTFFPEAKNLLGEKKLLEIGAAIAKVKAASARGAERATARKSSRVASKAVRKAARTTRRKKAS